MSRSHSHLNVGDNRAIVGQGYSSRYTIVIVYLFLIYAMRASAEHCADCAPVIFLSSWRPLGRPS
jgi:hypothetical protein